MSNQPTSESEANAPLGDAWEAPVVAELAEAPEAVLTTRKKFWLMGLVILKRVRFIAILAAVGVFVGKWDTVKNYWDKWVQPSRVAMRSLDSGHEFFCPMDPQVVQSTYEPNGDVPKCPICQMPLSVREKGTAVQLPPGITARVQLSPERVHQAGIQTVAVDYRPVVQQTKTVGYIAFDESRLSRVVSRVDGYVEKLYVDKTFTLVHQGDPLAEIYSPELFSTARELALATRDGGVADLAAAARKKLELLGVGRTEIDAIVASGKASPRLVLRSPQTGYVVDKKIVVGSSVDAKMTLLEIADLSTVWVEADVYEKDIAFLQVGQKVEATVEARPGAVFPGKLALIHPTLEAATRTNRIRFELANPRHELRPGMFATVRIQTPLEDVDSLRKLASQSGRIVLAGGAGGRSQREFLVVPERAVVDTGAKKVVYVERTPGLFEGVEVELGPRNDDVYPVLKGLRAGDKVAAAGGFLIDAETRLNPAAAAAYFGASGGPQSSSGISAPASVAPTPKNRNAAPATPAAPETTPATPDKPGAAPTTPQPGPRVAVAQLTADELKNIEQLPDADRKQALAQRICPVTGKPLGSMGVPVAIMLRGQPVYLCCAGCKGKAKREPDAMLQKLKEVAAAGAQ